LQRKKAEKEPKGQTTLLSSSNLSPDQEKAKRPNQIFQFETKSNLSEIWPIKAYLATLAMSAIKTPTFMAIQLKKTKVIVCCTNKRGPDTSSLWRQKHILTF